MNDIFFWVAGPGNILVARPEGSAHAVYPRHNSLFPLQEKSDHPDGDVKILDDVSIVDTWKAVTKLPKEKARAVGVSNFTKEHLQALIDGTGVTPAANQIERHPRLLQPELVQYCKEKNIHITEYSVSV